MIYVNENYLKLQSTYLFTDIAGKVAEFQEKNPDAKVIRMGIGDITKALPAACVRAFHDAVDEMATDETFRGYGPEQGYDFLREAAARVEFAKYGADIDADEIFVSDGAKCDTGNIQELFDTDIVVGVQDPVYPVYVDTNVMAGRTGESKNGRYERIVYFEADESTGFVPEPPKEKVDLIYLCFPNNPTGSVASKKQLKKWVDYAREHKSLILFDAAYATYIRDDELPRSIYEIPGAKQLAVEFRSFSKTAGFTGTRCALTVVPSECRVFRKDGTEQPLKELWNRRHTTKFNGVSYPVQRAAEAVYSEAGLRQTRELADYYLENARIIRSSMEELGYSVTGGESSPYIWIDAQRSSWEFFDELLEKAHVVCTPGVGFGAGGEGYIRLSAFNDRSLVDEAMSRIRKVLE